MCLVSHLQQSKSHLHVFQCVFFPWFSKVSNISFYTNMVFCCDFRQTSIYKLSIILESIHIQNQFWLCISGTKHSLSDNMRVRTSTFTCMIQCLCQLSEFWLKHIIYLVGHNPPPYILCGDFYLKNRLGSITDTKNIFFRDTDTENLKCIFFITCALTESPLHHYHSKLCHIFSNDNL